MKGSTIYAVIAVCSMGAVAPTVSAAELTNPAPASSATGRSGAPPPIRPTRITALR
jgi:hypothetical protein